MRELVSSAPGREHKHFCLLNSGRTGLERRAGAQGSALEILLTFPGGTFILLQGTKAHPDNEMNLKVDGEKVAYFGTAQPQQKPGTAWFSLCRAHGCP